VQACDAQPDGTLRLRFAQDADPVCAEVSALAVLLLPRAGEDARPRRAGERPPGLSQSCEVPRGPPCFLNNT